MVTIVPVDDVWVRVDAEEAVLREISAHFTFIIPAAKFMKGYRHWDGKIHLFKLREQLLYRGLLPRLMDYLAQHGHPVTSRVPTPDDLPLDDVIVWVRAQLLPVQPRPYQIAALRQLLADRRGIILSPTGSGKSLIMHLVVQYLNLPTLIVVPTTSLVAQLRNDFISYGVDASDIHTITAGQSKTTAAPITISTWQSIYELPPSYYAKFQCVFVDEVHLAKSKSLSGLMEKCVSVPYRFGCTGTLDDTQAHQLILEGLFGAVTRVTTTHQLMQQQHLTPLRVKLCGIVYPDAVKKSLRGASYQDEVEYLVTSPERLEIVARTAARAKGNVLVLFNFIEKHGVPLFDRIQHLVVDREVHFISGSVPGEERERVRQWVNQNDRQIIVASYGTFSTGIDLPKLDTLIFASPSKSKVRVLQSIGRSLRLHRDKTHATLVDFVDDLRTGTHVNHTFRHAELRVQYYASERFPYELHTLPVDGWIAGLMPRAERS